MGWVACVFSCTLIATVAAGDVITVDDDGLADYSSIQEAVNNSSNGDTIVVMPGVYAESINFYGRSIILTGTDPNDQALVETTIIRKKTPAGTVRFESYEQTDSVITGFNIQAVDTPGDEGGIGIYCYYASPTISKNIITNHNIGLVGESAQPLVIDNYIADNLEAAVDNCDGLIRNCRLYSGYAAVVRDCDGQMTDCYIADGYRGVYRCEADITNCVIRSNDADGLYECGARITNCVISGNSGNGLRLCDNEIINCTIANNDADGIESCEAVIKNCIITSNGYYGLSACTGPISYNNIWSNAYGSYGVGTIPGVSDTHNDPFFADPLHADYHLKSEVGRYDPATQTWIIDSLTSPCVDAADPADNPAKEPYPNGDRCNQGAYGGTDQASKSPAGQSANCTSPITADVDENCKVDMFDFAALASNWATSGSIEPNVISQWAIRYDGPVGGNDVGRAIALDSEGNIYVTGDIADSLSDSTTSCGTIKYDSSGNLLWAVSYRGAESTYNRGVDLGVDASGNVYVTGYGGEPEDFVTLKYDPNGWLLWDVTYNGPGNADDWASGLVVDSVGNVYVTGASQAGTTLTTYDYATLKYDSDGDLIWVRRYNGPADDYDAATCIAFDGSGNICVTGTSKNLDGNSDYATVKYDPEGNQLWARRYNGPAGQSDTAQAVIGDTLGNVYVTGSSNGGETDSDFATIKYDSDGNELWVERYNGEAGGYDAATAIVLDGSGNIIVTGQSDNIDSSPDYATVKYSPDGTELWARIYNAPGNGWDLPRAVAADGDSNVYVTGGGGEASGSYESFYTVKYDPDGNLIWAVDYDGPVAGEDFANAIVVDSLNNVYVTGESTGLDGDLDYATIGYSTVDICTVQITGDVNNSCTVDLADLALVAEQWLTCNLDPPQACWE